MGPNMDYTLMDIRIMPHMVLLFFFCFVLLFLYTNTHSLFQRHLYFILTDLVAVERPLELGGASGHAADGDRQQSLHQQRQSA